MTTRHFISKAAAQRILKDLAVSIISVRELKNCVQVTYKTTYGVCSTFIGKRAFKRDFIEFRVEGAKKARIHQFTGLNAIDVLCQGSDTWKAVSRLPNGQLMCNCHDWRSNRQICKHTIAVWEQVYKITVEV